MARQGCCLMAIAYGCYGLVLTMSASLDAVGILALSCIEVRAFPLSETINLLLRLLLLLLDTVAVSAAAGAVAFGVVLVVVVVAAGGGWRPNPTPKP